MAEKLPTNSPVFFYHCRDDEEIAFDNFKSYRDRFAKAAFRELESGGHMFTDGLASVVKDLEELKLAETGSSY